MDYSRDAVTLSRMEVQAIRQLLAGSSNQQLMDSAGAANIKGRELDEFLTKLNRS